MHVRVLFAGYRHYIIIKLFTQNVKVKIEVKASKMHSTTVLYTRLYRLLYLVLYLHYS